MWGRGWAVAKGAGVGVGVGQCSLHNVGGGGGGACDDEEEVSGAVRCWLRLLTFAISSERLDARPFSIAPRGPSGATLMGVAPRLRLADPVIEAEVYTRLVLHEGSDTHEIPSYGIRFVGSTICQLHPILDMAASHVLLLRGVAAALLLTSAVAFTPPPAIGRSALWPAGSPLATTARSPARCHGAVVATVRLDRRRRRAAAAAVVLAAADGGGGDGGEAGTADMKSDFERLAAIQRADKADKKALAEEYRQALRDQRQRQADAE